MASSSGDTTTFVEEGHSFMRNISDNALSSLTSVQKGFIVSIRSIDTSLSGRNLCAHIAELFPPASLFAKEICDTPTVWVDLRNFLNALGANLAPQSSRRVICTLAHGLYDDAEDRQAAVETSNLIVASERRVRSDGRNNTPSSVSNSNPQKPSDTDG